MLEGESYRTHEKGRDSAQVTDPEEPLGCFSAFECVGLAHSAEMSGRGREKGDPGMNYVSKPPIPVPRPEPLIPPPLDN